MKRNLLGRIWAAIGALVFLAALSSPALAEPIVSIYVDAAPNVYGSPDYPAWETAAFAAAANGGFVNMSSGINPANAGTGNFEIQDEVVYSFGDLGRRLTWLYYIPDMTKEEALAAGLSISLLNVWDGYSSDFYFDYYGQTWLTPTKVWDYNGGVIGLAGMAWVGGYSTNTQTELDADLAAWGSVDETWTFRVSLNEQITSFTSEREGTSGGDTPEPATMLLLGSGVAGIAAWRKRRKG